MQIQDWLDKIERPDGTKLKIKNILSAIFSHGIRWEFVERNPVCGQGGTPGHRGASTGVRQSNRISISRVILPPDVVGQTLEQLPLREATMVLVDAVTALRASELVALKWRNVGWDTSILRSEFAFVEGELKDTKSRNNALPLARPVLNVLRLWREHTPYRSDEDWIFASPHYHGKTPYTYQILFQRHIQPVIERVSNLKSSKQAPIGFLRSWRGASRFQFLGKFRRQHHLDNLLVCFLLVGGNRLCVELQGYLGGGVTKLRLCDLHILAVRDQQCS